METKVHETSVDKVQAGLPARITVEAFPDKVFTGEVTKVSPLPDAQRGFLNPDLKVYNTDVSISELEQSLRPGMSAKVEIIIDQFENILYVPVQAIVNREGTKYCFVQTSNDLEERKVKAGAFNENFIVIYEGLKEGEKVSLNPPRTVTGMQPKPKPVPAGTGKSTKPQTAKSGEGRPDQGDPGQKPGPSAQGPGGRQMPGGMNMDMMKKLQDPEVQKKLKKAAEEGKLAEELKTLGIEVPPEMIKQMEQMIKSGAGRPGGDPGGRSGGRGERGGRSGGGPGQRSGGGPGGGPNRQN